MEIKYDYLLNFMFVFLLFRYDIVVYIYIFDIQYYIFVVNLVIFWFIFIGKVFGNVEIIENYRFLLS